MLGWEIILEDASVWTPAVTTNAATNIVSDGARLNGNLTDLDGEASVEVLFEYGETTAYGTSTTPETKSTTGTFYADLTSLDPGTYHFRAIVRKTDDSEPNYGEDLTFSVGSTYSPAIIVVC
jgi:hypothetical protein